MRITQEQADKLLTEYNLELKKEEPTSFAVQLHSPYTRRENDTLHILDVETEIWVDDPLSSIIMPYRVDGIDMAVRVYSCTTEDYNLYVSGQKPLPHSLSLTPYPPTTEQTLAAICQKYIHELRIDGPETIYQADRVTDHSLQWVAELCETLNMYYEES